LEPDVYILHERLKSFPPAQMIYIIYRRLVEHGIFVTYLWITDKILRRIQGFSPPKISKVIPGLYVGGQQSKRGLAKMRTLGINAVVNLREESDDVTRGVGLDHYLWLPTPDDAPSALDDLDRGSLFIEKQLSTGRSVYVHCAAGVGRAPTLVAAYLVYKGMIPEDAWATVREVRPFIRPTPPQIEIINVYANALVQRTVTAEPDNVPAERSVVSRSEKAAFEPVGQEPPITAGMIDYEE
jgi:atypical dual specificity phosphatase